MRILGLDISKNSTGYAIMEFPEETIIKTGYIKNPKDQKTGEHLCRFRDHIEHLMSEYKVDVVVMEDLFMAFLSTAKAIIHFHGVAKEVTHRFMEVETTAYASQSWRHRILGIKKFSKDEKKEFEIVAKKVKGTKYKTYHKHLCDIKHRVIEYVNKRLNTKYIFEQNDIVDALGLCVAHYDEVYSGL